MWNKNRRTGKNKKHTRHMQLYDNETNISFGFCANEIIIEQINTALSQKHNKRLYRTVHISDFNGMDLFWTSQKLLPIKIHSLSSSESKYK